MSQAWRFMVYVKWRGPDQHGEMREWEDAAELTGIGNERMSEVDARALAQRQLDTNPHTRRAIFGKHPNTISARLGPGWRYEEHLPDLDE